MCHLAMDTHRSNAPTPLACQKSVHPDPSHRKSHIAAAWFSGRVPEPSLALLERREHFDRSCHLAVLPLALLVIFSLHPYAKGSWVKFEGDHSEDALWVRDPPAAVALVAP